MLWLGMIACLTSCNDTSTTNEAANDDPAVPTADAVGASPMDQRVVLDVYTDYI